MGPHATTGRLVVPQPPRALAYNGDHGLGGADGEDRDEESSTDAEAVDYAQVRGPRNSDEDPEDPCLPVA